MTPDDIARLHAIVQDGLKDADHFNKLYIAFGTLLGVFVGMLVQIGIALMQTRTQKGIAAGSAKLQKDVVRDQLAMQEETSKRIARDNINTKRQAWIDNLREDIAEFITLWHQLYTLYKSLVTDKLIEVKPFMEQKTKLIERVDLLTVRIQLRLNPNEHRHQRFFLLMRLLNKRASIFDMGMKEDDYIVARYKYQQTAKHIVRAAQGIFKSEWERIKRDAVNPASFFDA